MIKRLIQLLAAVAILLIAPMEPVEAQDTSVVRIRVDVTDISISIDQQPVNQDSYGNILLPNNWFILLIDPGDHTIGFTGQEISPFDTTFSVLPDEVFVLDMTFAIPDDSIEYGIDSTLPPSVLILESDPVSCNVVLADVPSEEQTPFRVQVEPGLLNIELFHDDYEPLTHQFDMIPGDTISAQFILRHLEPPPMTAESLGLSLVPTRVPRDIKEAEFVREKYNNLAESFAVVPLAQGIMAKMLVGNESQKEADILLVSGLVLTGGSWLIGRIVGSRRSRQIEEYNAQVTRDNDDAKEHNGAVTNELKAANKERRDVWKEENKQRGRVVIQER